MEKINTELYGGKSPFSRKETPVEAEIICCDNYSECDFYKDGQCLKMRRFLGIGCIYGSREVIKGYTSRAKKYSEFYRAYHGDETYGRLKSLNRSSKRFAVVGDYYYFDLESLYIAGIGEKKENRINKVISCKSGRMYEINEKDVIGMSECLIPKEDVTADFLNELLGYRFFQLFFGNNGEANKRYHQKTVPDILTQIRDRVPELYEQLIAEYPAFADIMPDYRGRNAFIKTMKEGSILKARNGEEYVLHDGKLTGTYHDAFLPFGSRQAEIVIDVTDDMTYVITDNNQVDENTKFL